MCLRIMSDKIDFAFQTRLGDFRASGILPILGQFFMFADYNSTLKQLFLSVLCLFTRYRYFALNPTVPRHCRFDIITECRAAAPSP